MKIGDFSKKYQLSQPTLRYYISLGLLIPEVKNKQYIFTEECERDMTFIIRLKSACFSLKEIHEILSLYRISNFAQAEDVEPLVRYWEKRKQSLEEEHRENRRKLEKSEALWNTLKKEMDTYENS